MNHINIPGPPADPSGPPADNGTPPDPPKPNRIVETSFSQRVAHSC